MSSDARLGHYRILSRIGAGGMGEVYLAQDTKLDRRVALKILPAELASDQDRIHRFVREAKAASALNHPNIITIHEIDETPSGHYIATEFIEGETLRAYSLRSPLTLEKSVDIAAQIASALAAAHAAGIVHRDIKPENVMVRRDGIVKVLDFGLAKLTEQVAGDAVNSEGATRVAIHTEPGIIMGTVAYMSPEQARGQTTDARSDIWSLGVVLYEMLTARQPFEGETTTDRLAAILRNEAVPPSNFNRHIPAELERMVLQALRKNIAERYQSADALRTDLQQFKKHLEFTAELERSSSASQRREAETQVLRVVTVEQGDTRKTILDRSITERHTVGREAERAALRAGLTSVLSGRGLLVSVAGEPGIGKTTLAEDFLAEVISKGDCTVARGRCSERLAGTEAYLPLLEALESLIENENSMATLMKQVAPTWYAQVVPLSTDDEETTKLMNEIRAASQERMKRELGTFLQQVSRQRPVVLFFDDLHWADVSTIDILSFLAGKFDTLGLLILVTYRPSDLLLMKHPFLQIKPDLQARGLCREVTLEFLSEADVAEYLALEFPESAFTSEFPKLLHAKTEGSPLFIADLVRYLRDRRVIANASGVWKLERTLPDLERELPESVRGMIERKIAQLSDQEHKLLVAASVQGYEFDSAVVARVLKVEAEEVEERLEKLDRTHAFVKLVEEREYPNHTLTLRYRFVHVLYQNALYSSLRPTRKLSLSREVAESIETCYGEDRASAATELADLWEASRQYGRAAEYFTLAAQQAAQISAAREAAALARHGLRMVEMLPESHAQRQQELSLQIILGNVLCASKGYAAPEVDETFSRAYRLGKEVGDPQYLLPLLWGLHAVSFCRAQYKKALAYGEEFVRLAQTAESPALVIGYSMLGSSFFWMGDFDNALAYLRQSTVFYSPAKHRALTWTYGHEPGMYAEVFLAFTLWMVGYPEQALAHTKKFLRLGVEASHAQSKAFALSCAATIYQWYGDSVRVTELADEGLAFSEEQGLPFWRGIMTVTRGWARAEQGDAIEGIAEMRRGLADFRATGAEITVASHLVRLGEAYGKAGQPREGLAVLSEDPALAEDKEERCWEADLYRIKGELLRDTEGAASEVEVLFNKAIKIARRQKAKSIELRGAMSLARLWQRQGKRAEAQQLLAHIYNWFTEGFETADLKAARELLNELS
jgi:serine/threonine protein kinase/tetratricopeptide (TPR) repeat protein